MHVALFGVRLSSVSFRTVQHAYTKKDLIIYAATPPN